MARVDDDLVAYGIPDRGSGLVGWDTTDGVDAALMDEYEWWGITPDGRHCCTECVGAADDHDSRGSGRKLVVVHPMLNRIHAFHKPMFRIKHDMFIRAGCERLEHAVPK